MKRFASALLPVIFLILAALLFTGCSINAFAAPEVPPTATPAASPTPPPTPAPTPPPYAEGIDICGSQYMPGATKVIMHSPSAQEIDLFCKAAPFILAKNAVIDLGDDVSSPIRWEDLLRLEEALKTDEDSLENVKFTYSFTLYDKPFSLADKKMDLNHIRIDDQGELVRKVIACMPNLEVLDMDFCRVDDEHMAKIREDFPSVKVIWRVWFGGAYSVRTDVTKILASAPGTGGDLKISNTGALRYCNDVKYLDVGHNEILKDISFVSYMPDLEVAILAMLNVKDISPLADCKKLEYLELQTNQITDLSPLKELKGLHHLNIAYNFELKDISPLYGLTNLERLWIGALTPIPEDQVAEMKKHVPGCVIETTYWDPHDGWRWGNDRYDLLVEQFGYDKAAYSFQWLDPLYEPHD